MTVKVTERNARKADRVSALNTGTLERVGMVLESNSATKLNLLLDDEPWRLRSACKDIPVEVFFPERGRSPEPALRVCRSCPVRTECAEWVLTDTPSPKVYRTPDSVAFVQQGIVAGTTAKQREWLHWHPDEARRVAAECAAAGVSVDELADWYTAVGPGDDIVVAVAGKHTFNARAWTGPRFGVTRSVFDRWVAAAKTRGHDPAEESQRNVRVSGKRRGMMQPQYRDAYSETERLLIEAADWMPQKQIMEHLANKMCAYTLGLHETAHWKRAPTSAWSYLVGIIVQSFEREGVIVRKPDPKASKQSQQSPTAPKVVRWVGRPEEQYG